MISSFVAFWAMVTFAAVDDAKDPKPADARPAMTWTGDNSLVTQPGFVRADSTAGWSKLWNAHTGKTDQQAWMASPRIDIDFSKHCVVAIFAGSVTNQRGYRVVSVDESGKSIIVRFERETFQSMGRPPAKEPFIFMLLPRTPKTVVMEENTQGLKDKPAKWTKQAELPPLAAQ